MRDLPTKILLVEDNPGDARLIRELLADARGAPIAVECVQRLAAGIDRLAAGGIDAVLLDLNLPDSQGLTTWARFRVQAPPLLPIILLTGLGDEDLGLRAVQEGAQDYLVKGKVDGNLLVRTIRYAIERKRAETALRESEERVRLLLDSTAEAIYGLDKHGACTFANPACLRLLGFQDDRDVLGKNMHDLIHHTRADGTPYPVEACHIFQAFQRGEGVHVEDEVLWRADGTSFHAEYWSYPILRDAEVIGSVVTFLDISDRKRAEEELKTAHLQLIQSAKLESVGRLAAGVAHEVKNPLAIIQQGVGYLSRSTAKSGDDTASEILEKMENAVKRADRVIRGLLDFSAPGALEMTSTQLNEVVEQSLLLVKHALVRGRVSVVTGLSESLPLIHLDRHKIEQVFVNLFMNAIQAMPEGGTLTVKTTARQATELGPGVGRRGTDRFRSGEIVVLGEVDDTGAGIPAEKLERIFDPFFTTKPVGEGTGLGLSVTRQIVEMHGGTIHITNRQEGGVRVSLTFKTEGDTTDGEKTDTGRRR